MSNSYILSTGAAMPAVAIGTRRSPIPGAICEIVHNALLAGYRHIDTAQGYGCESEVGQAIRESGISRKEIWITTKLDNQWHQRVGEALELSLKALGVDYIDMYLMHWPCPVDPDDLDKALPDWHFTQTWCVHRNTSYINSKKYNDWLTRQAMQQLPSNQVRNIGVANFDIHNMNILLSHPSTNVVPAVNQIELHPYNISTALVTYCKKRGIQCMGFSPLGSKGSSLVCEPELMKIANCHRRTPQQVLLKWGLQNGWGVIPGSFKKDHIVANIDLDGWVLGEDEVLRLSNMKKRERVYDDVKRMRLPIRVFLDEELDTPGPT